MSERNAYQGEMGSPRSDPGLDLDRLLADGRDPALGNAELAAFAHALRATFRSEPSADIAARHLAEIRVAAALPASRARPVAPRRRRAWRLALSTVVVALSLPLLAAGLAFAGVALPGAANSTFERLGIDLPNQGPDEASSGDPAPAGGERENSGSAADQPPRSAEGEEASAFGRCVADAARSSAPHPNRRCADLRAGTVTGEGKPGAGGGASGNTGKAKGSSGKERGNSATARGNSGTATGNSGKAHGNSGK
jgi:hypothetical protein